MEKTRIGVISDTHGLLREQVIRELESCSAILHGGDINRQEMIDQLRKIAPVYVVRGNNDKEWAQHIPYSLDLSLFGLHIFMTHKKKDLPSDISVYDLVVIGHTHRYEKRMAGKTIVLNPGSCGPRRFNQDITMAVLVIDPVTNTFDVQRIDIPHERKTIRPGDLDMKKVINQTIKEIRKGTSTDDIARELNIDPELSEQICRLYLTHPGVDADEIMTKMGL